MPRHEIQLRDETLHLLPERAIHWPARRALLVADLHWGKDEAFRTRGVRLPEGILAEDLTRLSSCIQSTDTNAVYILGDLIHHRDGMSRTVIDQVAAWRREQPLPMHLIPGNHDRHFPDLPAEWHIERHPESVDLGPFRLVHDPTLPNPSPNYRLGGHIHPVLTLGRRNDRVTLPCFQFTETYGLLPAFSRFTGGARITPDKTDRCYLTTEARIVSA